MSCNYYDAVIQDLRYYERDHRRSKAFREILGKAISALEGANKELKEAQRVISTVEKASSAVIDAIAELQRYTEETT